MISTATQLKARVRYFYGGDGTKTQMVIRKFIMVFLLVSCFCFINTYASVADVQDDPLLNILENEITSYEQLVEEVRAEYESFETTIDDANLYIESMDQSMIYDEKVANLRSLLAEAETLKMDVDLDVIIPFNSSNNLSVSAEEITYYLYTMQSKRYELYSCISELKAYLVSITGELPFIIEDTESDESVDLAETSDTPVTEIVAEPEENEWKTIVYDYEVDGYTIRETLTYSRIYKCDDEKLVSLWNEIGSGNPLPGMDDWGFTHYTDNTWDADFGTTAYEAPGMLVHSKANDMYYMLGTIKYENITEGWDLSSDRSVSVHPAIMVPYNSGNPDLIVGRVFYSNSEKTMDSFIALSAEMTRNTWGPTPFVIGFIEYYAPDYPDGKYRELYYKRDGGYLSFNQNMLDMVFADEPQIIAAELPVDADPDVLTFEDFPLSEKWQREDLKKRFGESDWDETERVDYYNIEFLGFDGDLRFYFEEESGNWRINCISWTSSVCTQELYDEILNLLKENGTYKGLFEKNSDSDKQEEVVEINGTDYIIGLESSANGEYLYVFSEFWN